MSKKPMGRPSTYDPAICDKIPPLGKLGYSFEKICSELEVAHSTMDNWAGAYPDLRAAIDLAKQYELAHWEDLAQNHMVEVPGGPRVNSSLWSRSMAARFPSKYRENSKVEVSGKDGGAIEVDMIHDFGKHLMNELLASRQKDAESSND